MIYELILAFVILTALVFYALGGGADFGGGIWDLFATGSRARRQRETIAHAIAPIWEANHVWLILVLVILFAGFPVSFSVMMTALHIPMSAILIGIVLRGSAFAFRSYDKQDDAVHLRWSTIFGQASFFTPFLLGLCLGALASGEIRFQNGNLTSGFFAGWTKPFAISCGLFAQGLFSFLAASYLAVDAQPDKELQNDFRRRAIFSALLLFPIAVAVFLLARNGAPYIFNGLTNWWAPILLLATSTSAVLAISALLMRRFILARAAAVMQVTFILLGWGVAQFPYIVVPDITFFSAATEQSTLKALTWALAIGALILFPSFGYLFFVFKRASRPESD